MGKPLTIGHLARTTGVNVETVRYYQRFGIISGPPKPAEAYRIYPPETVDHIRFIKRAQQLILACRKSRNFCSWEMVTVMMFDCTRNRSVPILTSKSRI